MSRKFQASRGIIDANVAFHRFLADDDDNGPKLGIRVASVGSLRADEGSFIYFSHLLRTVWWLCCCQAGQLTSEGPPGFQRCGNAALQLCAQSANDGFPFLSLIFSSTLSLGLVTQTWCNRCLWDMWNLRWRRAYDYVFLAHSHAAHTPFLLPHLLYLLSVLSLYVFCHKTLFLTLSEKSTYILLSLCHQPLV